MPTAQDTIVSSPSTAGGPNRKPGWNRKRSLLALGGVAAAIVGAWLAFGFFGIQSAFIDNEVAEDGPTFASGAQADEVAVAEESQTPTADSGTTAAETDSRPGGADGSGAATNGTTPGEILTTFSGDFSSLSRYSVTGEANVLNDGTEQRFLRFEAFESSNGPDLKVYLRADDGEFVNLGELKGNVGEQNYEIPPEVDLQRFSTVEIWCERFSVGFGEAELAAA